MTAEIKVFPRSKSLAEALAEELLTASLQAEKSGFSFNLVLAGGSTPRGVYEIFAQSGFKKNIPWEVIHFFWGDERLVPPDHKDSNFLMAHQAMLGPLAIPGENIHRIQGENEPSAEASRYAEEIRRHYNLAHGEIPKFDWIFLGLGTDGHTASLFPGVVAQEDHTGLCAVSVHPDSGQKRISLTLNVLNHAKRVSFIVTGKGKAEVVGEILNRSPKSQPYPATQVQPVKGQLEWFLDQEAASMIKNKS